MKKPKMVLKWLRRVASVWWDVARFEHIVTFGSLTFESACSILRTNTNTFTFGWKQKRYTTVVLWVVVATECYLLRRQAAMFDFIRWQLQIIWATTLCVDIRFSTNYDYVVVWWCSSGECYSTFHKLKVSIFRRASNVRSFNTPTALSFKTWFALQSPQPQTFLTEATYNLVFKLFKQMS